MSKYTNLPWTHEPPVDTRTWHGHANLAGCTRGRLLPGVREQDLRGTCIMHGKSSVVMYGGSGGPWCRYMYVHVPVVRKLTSSSSSMDRLKSLG